MVDWKNVYEIKGTKNYIQSKMNDMKKLDINYTDLLRGGSGDLLSSPNSLDLIPSVEDHRYSTDCWRSDYRTNDGIITIDITKNKNKLIKDTNEPEHTLSIFIKTT
jgi:hypothetical protein